MKTKPMSMKFLWTSLSIILLGITNAIATNGLRSDDHVKTQKFTAFTRPLTLRQGEVTNTFHRLKIPKGPIAIYRFEADVVEKDSKGNVIPTPIFDAYLHHHVVGSDHRNYIHQKGKWAPMKPANFSRGVGFGAGTEARGTPQEFQFPFAFLTVEGEDELIANVHIINTRQMTPKMAHECLECPCTSEDVFTKESVNGRFFYERSCNAELLYENNTACHANTYHGGLRCCEEKEFCQERNVLLEKEATSTYYLRYSIEYATVVKANRALYLAGCCDATGDLISHGNIEYDLPPCDPNIHPGCVHTLATRQYLDKGGQTIYDFGAKHALTGDREVELVYVVGHQHRAGMGIHLYNDATGELLCSSLPKYGKSDQILDEKDYIVSMSTCTFDPPIRMKTSDIVRIVSLYNNTLSHTGVMSLMYLAIADVIKSPEITTATATATATSTNVTATSTNVTSVWFKFIQPQSNGMILMWFVAACVLLVVLAIVAHVGRKKWQKRRGYLSLSNYNNSVPPIISTEMDNT